MIKKLIYLLAGLLFFSRKVDDVLSRMARRKPGSQHVQRAPFLGVPCREFCFPLPCGRDGVDVRSVAQFMNVLYVPVFISLLPSRVEP